MIYADLEDDILPSKRHHNINILLVMQNCDNPEIYITFISTEGALRLLITIPSNPNPSIHPSLHIAVKTTSPLKI